MKDNNIHDIIGKYLAKEITDNEVLIFNEWVNRCDENLNEFNLHKKAWEETRIRYTTEGSDLVFREVLNKIDDHNEVVESNTPKKAHRRIYVKVGFISKIAATFLIILAFGYLIIRNIENAPPEDTSVAIIEKINPAGQKSKTFLPDGSEVWLNAESKLSYPEMFSDSIREVLLEGEAFFSVVKNPEKPFVVRTGNISTTVLGTSFNIHAYTNEPSTYVALQSGKVKVDIKSAQGNREMFLEPGEGISYNRSSHLTVKEEFDEDILLGWKDGIINFEDANVDQVFSTLSRWYGVEFEIKNKKNESWTYEGTYKDETLENVLKGISFTKSFSYDFVNPKYVIVELN